jgi:hypothetical protein
MLQICSKTSGGEIPFDTSKIKPALQIVYSANIPLISHRPKLTQKSSDARGHRV